MAGVYLATHVSSSFIFLFMGEKDAIISLCLSHMAYLLFFENRMAGGKKTQNSRFWWTLKHTYKLLTKKFYRSVEGEL